MRQNYLENNFASRPNSLPLQRGAGGVSTSSAEFVFIMFQARLKEQEEEEMVYIFSPTTIVYAWVGRLNPYGVNNCNRVPDEAAYCAGI